MTLFFTFFSTTKKSLKLAGAVTEFETLLWCRIFGFCLLLFPQNDKKIYKLRQLSLSQFVCFSLILREGEETKTKYSAPLPKNKNRRQETNIEL
jgi:hypothetical protein